MKAFKLHMQVNITDLLISQHEIETALRYNIVQLCLSNINILPLPAHKGTPFISSHLGVRTSNGWNSLQVLGTSRR